MQKKFLFSPKEYITRKPQKAKLISKAVKYGIKQYAETLRRLANT